MSAPLELTGVVHLVRPAGERVRDLEALRAALARVSDRSLFCHARLRWLRRPAAPELPPDDVSAWVAGVVQDRETAERLSYAAESAGGSADALRAAWLAVLDSVPERARAARDAPEGGEFVFLTADAVPVPSGRVAGQPHELMSHLADAEPSVWFWHLIEQPWDERGAGELPRWLADHGEPRLAEWLAGTAADGRPLAELRRLVVRRWRLSRLGDRVAAAAHETRDERERAGRDAIANLTRRLRRREAS